MSLLVQVLVMPKLFLCMFGVCTGSIPSTIAKLSSLTSLILSSNSLTGRCCHSSRSAAKVV